MNKNNMFKLAIITLLANSVAACTPTEPSTFHDVDPDLKKEIKLQENCAQSQSPQELSDIPFILDEKTAHDYVISPAVRDSVDRHSEQIIQAMIAKRIQQQK
ncbi:MAG: hypothetical protein K2L94_02240 [Alphaproteobacteria bacterium]|nr:hypothetical protein [Alphaproteobacteria bacterium]